MWRTVRNERGMALAIAIFALVVVGALVAGAFFAGVQESRTAENNRRLQKAFGVTEAGINEVIADWDPGVRNVGKMYPADSQVLPDAGEPGTLPYHTGAFAGNIYKLNGELYLVDIAGRDSQSINSTLKSASARQRMGGLLRIRTVNFGIQGALTTRGGVKLAGNAAVDGRDHIPTEWGAANCDTTGDTTKAGIRTADTSQISGGAGHTYGTPPIRQDTSVNTSTFRQFGDIDYATLAAMATITISSGNYKTNPAFSGGNCDKTDRLNWGDGMNRASACGNYFPIIHITDSTQSTTLNGDQGQGILLVDGDLSIQGSYQFYGIVLIRGSLKTAGGGSTDAHFWGAVMAANVDLELNTLTGNATLNYSKCAITEALERTGAVSLARSRSWIQLF
jgi:type II secretory pathway pseudopilin PulG